MTVSKDDQVVILNPQGGEFYVKINGVVGAKVSTTRDKANTYADRVVRGLVRFEPLGTSVIKALNCGEKPPYLS